MAANKETQLERRVQQTTRALQNRQERHRKVVEKYIKEESDLRAKVDRAQEALAAHRRKRK